MKTFLIGFGLLFLCGLIATIPVGIIVHRRLQAEARQLRQRQAARRTAEAAAQRRYDALLAERAKGGQHG